MKVVILAGGLGTRLSEETEVKPKPMVEIGDHPMLWHIMKIYGEQGFQDFVVCLGYKGYVDQGVLRQLLPAQLRCDVRPAGTCMEVHQNTVEPWRVTLVDTGAETQTGGRLKRIASYLDGERFLMTYGDGVADIDLSALISCPRRAWKTCHGDGCAATRALRRPRDRRRRGRGAVLHREAARRRGLDERRLLRARARRA